MSFAVLPQGLIDAALRGQVAHAYMFIGSTDDAAFQLATADLAQALNCPTPRAGAPCSQCAVCRRIAAGVHPDVHVVAPAGSSLGTEQVGSLLKELTLQSVEGSWRVFLLLAAQRLTAAGANRLLKNLEEPPPRTVLILAVDSSAQLPATVVSRCQAIILGKAPTAMTIDQLMADTGIAAATAQYLVRLAGLDGAVAAELLAAGAAAELRDQVLTAVANLMTGEPLAVLAAADILAANGDKIETALLVLDALWRDLRVCQAGLSEGHVYHGDMLDKLTAMAQSAPTIALDELLTVSAQLRVALAARVGRQLACEAACIRLAATLRRKPSL